MNRKERREIERSLHRLQTQQDEMRKWLAEPPPTDPGPPLNRAERRERERAWARYRRKLDRARQSLIDLPFEDRP